jgi:hypothetical protein
MTNEAKIVAAKRELVDRERGCRMGGILDDVGTQLLYESNFLGVMRKDAVLSVLLPMVRKQLTKWTGFGFAIRTVTNSLHRVIK